MPGSISEQLLKAARNNKTEEVLQLVHVNKQIIDQETLTRAALDAMHHDNQTMFKALLPEDLTIKSEVIINNYHLNETLIVCAALRQKWGMVTIIANDRRCSSKDLEHYGFALLEAAKNDRTEVVHALIQAGAPITWHFNRHAPIHFAIDRNDSELLKLLLPRQDLALMYDSDSKTQTPIQYAALRQKWAMVTIIANDRRCSSKDPEHYGFALLEAAKNNRIEVVYALIQAGAPLTSAHEYWWCDGDGSFLYYPLHHALHQRNEEMVALLIEHAEKSDPNWRNSPPFSTALKFAQKEGHDGITDQIYFSLGITPFLLREHTSPKARSAIITINDTFKLIHRINLDGSRHSDLVGLIPQTKKAILDNYNHHESSLTATNEKDTERAASEFNLTMSQILQEFYAKMYEFIIIHDDSFNPKKNLPQEIFIEIIDRRIKDCLSMPELMQLLELLQKIEKSSQPESQPFTVFKSKADPFPLFRKTLQPRIMQLLRGALNYEPDLKTIQTLQAICRNNQEAMAALHPFLDDEIGNLDELDDMGETDHPAETLPLPQTNAAEAASALPAAQPAVDEPDYPNHGGNPDDQDTDEVLFHASLSA